MTRSTLRFSVTRPCDVSWSRQVLRFAAVEPVRPGGPGGAFTNGTPEVLLELAKYQIGLIGRGFHISKDDQKFLMVAPVTRDSTDVPTIIVVVNWIEELKSRAGAK